MIQKTPDLCPCGTAMPFSACCKPLLDGVKPAETAEQLMRSRYTAFHQRNGAYLCQTCWPIVDSAAERLELEQQLKMTNWLELKVISTQKGKAQHDKGKVEFIATYTQSGQLGVIHTLKERSNFKKLKGRWFYTEGRVEQS